MDIICETCHSRAAVLPFFVLAVGLVFFWTRREFGEFAGAMAALLLSTLPVILAFSGLAYTDMATGCMQFAALFAFTRWLEKPTMGSSSILGVITGLAFLAKFTTLLFLPAGAGVILLFKLAIQRRSEPTPNDVKTGWLTKLAVVLAAAVVVVWAGYGFSVGHVRQSMQLSPESMPSFQHFPGPARNIARSMVLRDSWLPAPALVKGAATAWALNKNAPLAYLLGKEKNGGWWYFFLVAVAVKTPLPFLLLCLIGLCVLFSRALRWTSIAPAAAVLAVFCVTMFVKYNAGIRHVMVVFPLLAVVAGCACGFLWQSPGRWRLLGRSTLVVLLLWQCIASLNAHPDYIAYFNELAGRDPSRVLVTGCDLDCGQDLFRLSRTLHERNISHLNIAVWSSADMSRMNFPAFEIRPPFQPVTGWLAISLRSLRMGDVFHTTYPAGAFSWLDGQKPVEQVGKTIRLYYFPPNGLTGSAKVQLDSNQPR